MLLVEFRILAVAVAAAPAVPVATVAAVPAVGFTWCSPRGRDRLASVTGPTDPDTGV
ncbi:hypothetical protein GZL_00352 [Streptomyces sp. 769]|nr:hypothetical protein GZL_00352 [Streptomyces sp. 769]